MTVVKMQEPVVGIVQAWARESLRPQGVDHCGLPDSTLLLRSGGPWDGLIAFADHHHGILTPVLVLKNPVPLWQQPRTLEDGELTFQRWSALRRDIIIHNPGLHGFAELVDRSLGARSGNDQT